MTPRESNHGCLAPSHLLGLSLPEISCKPLHAFSLSRAAALAIGMSISHGISFQLMSERIVGFKMSTPRLLFDGKIDVLVIERIEKMIAIVVKHAGLDLPRQSKN